MEDGAAIVMYEPWMTTITCYIVAIYIFVYFPVIFVPFVFCICLVTCFSLPQLSLCVFLSPFLFYVCVHIYSGFVVYSDFHYGDLT